MALVRSRCVGFALTEDSEAVITRRQSTYGIMADTKLPNKGIIKRIVEA